MLWTPELKELCFQNNGRFITNYCSPETLLQMRGPDDDRIRTVREVARFFAETFPYIAHSTPKWDRQPGESIPLIKFGKASERANGGIQLTRFAGLYLIENELRIWVCEEIWTEIPDEYEWETFRDTRKYCSNRTASELINDKNFVAVLARYLNTNKGSQNKVCPKTLIQWGKDVNSNKLIHSCTPLMIHLRNRLRYWSDETH